MGITNGDIMMSGKKRALLYFKISNAFNCLAKKKTAEDFEELLQEKQ